MHAARLGAGAGVKRRRPLPLLPLLPLLFVTTTCGRQTTMPMYEVSAFGRTDDRQAVELYSLTNQHGMRATITNYGGIVTGLWVPDRSGEFGDVVLGYDNLEDYVAGSPYFGAVVGRYGNRIADGRFTLDDTEYNLVVNNGPNHLHGGIKGFDKVIWHAEPYAATNEVGVRLNYVSADGEEGYPGNLTVTVTYALTNENELRIHYLAETDRATVVNLTHHGYFNLAGHAAGGVLGHEMMLVADRFTPVDENLIPTGELRDVGGTPMDFLAPHTIGERIDSEDEQIQFGAGYDHNWVINGEAGTLRLAARVAEPTTGRVMEVFTTEPGVQFYAGNFLDGSNIGKGGVPYLRRSGFCLETQHFPDSPNNVEFPTTVLRPGERFESTTIYEFSVR